ncbi:hypothetical protein KFE25_006144 [Diacronema lutheri]|mgnify:CR=1 FL=1|uniref:Chloride channel protein n=2 Tax=Diacronema lutheri TaxID=2081491 RepID=A0A8J6CEI3_DIALT|nr:hypothetical protein KFE25_006144 [Diacronema lutheri]
MAAMRALVFVISVSTATSALRPARAHGSACGRLRIAAAGGARARMLLPRPALDGEGAPAGAELVSLAAATGCGTAVLVVAFKRAVLECSTLLHGPLLPDGPALPFWALPVLGGCAVAALRTSTPASVFESSLGRNVQAATDGAPVDVGAAVVRSLASVLTLGSGCSLGPEGPAVELGATVSRLSAALVRELTSAQRRTLACSGAAAGVAAGFNAPLAAIAFAYEVASARRSAVRAARAADTLPAAPGGTPPKFVPLLPVCVASLTSAAVARALLSNELSFAAALPVGDGNGASLAELPTYLLLGCFCGGGATAFRAALAGARGAFRERIAPVLASALHPLLGGAACGAISACVPQVQFSSYETLDMLVSSWAQLASPADPLLLYAAKVAATSVCLGSGLVGGLFAPSLFLGAALGAAFSQAAAGISLLLGVPEALPAELILTGAASVLGAVLSSPLTSALLVFDLTHNARLLLPSLLAATIASALTDELAPESGQAALPLAGDRQPPAVDGLAPTAKRPR